MIRVILATLFAGAVFGLGGCSSKRVTVPQSGFVTPAPVLKPAPSPSPTISFIASPSTINKGESSILIWSAENAASVNIDGGVGRVEAWGKKSVTPPASTTYTAVAEGSGGSASASTRVTVIDEGSVTPPPPRPTSDSEFFSTHIGDIFFDFDKYNLRHDAIATLDNNVTALTERPAIRLTIEGHCDERGSEKYNLALGDRRAQAARQYLLLQGIRTDRINTVSYGEERPFVVGHTEEAWSKNRRSHFVLREGLSIPWIWFQ